MSEENLINPEDLEPTTLSAQTPTIIKPTEPKPKTENASTVSYEATNTDFARQDYALNNKQNTSLTTDHENVQPEILKKDSQFTSSLATKAIVAVIVTIIVFIFFSYVRKQNNLESIRSESNSAITALHATVNSREGGGSYCVGSENGGSSHCFSDAIITTTLEDIKADGWTKTNVGGKFQNEKYNDCHLSSWNTGPNKYFLSCTNSW
jgi:hypothetical protein